MHFLMGKIVVFEQWFRNRREASFHVSRGKVFLSAG